MNRAEMKQAMGPGLRQMEAVDINRWLTASGSVPQMAAALAEANIRTCVVSMAEELCADPLAANEELSGLIAGHRGIYAAGVLVPEAAYEKGGAAGYIDRLTDRGFVMFRVFPARYNHSLSDWCMGGILSYLEERGLPLVVWHSQTSFDAIAKLCSDHPRLPVIVEGNDRKLLYHNRSYIPLLERFSNLYLETHNLVQYLVYEYIVERFGGGRLLFGTYAPFNDPGAAMMPLLCADISQEDKKKIFSGNANKLLFGA